MRTPPRIGAKGASAPIAAKAGGIGQDRSRGKIAGQVKIPVIRGWQISQSVSGFDKMFSAMSRGMVSKMFSAMFREMFSGMFSGMSREMSREIFSEMVSE